MTFDFDPLVTLGQTVPETYIRDSFGRAMGSSRDNLNVTEKFRMVFKHPHALGKFICKARKNKYEKEQII